MLLKALLVIVFLILTFSIWLLFLKGPKPILVGDTVVIEHIDRSDWSSVDLRESSVFLKLNSNVRLDRLKALTKQPMRDVHAVLSQKGAKSAEVVMTMPTLCRLTIKQPSSLPQEFNLESNQSLLMLHLQSIPASDLERIKLTPPAHILESLVFENCILTEKALASFAKLPTKYLVFRDCEITPEAMKSVTAKKVIVDGNVSRNLAKALVQAGVLEIKCNELLGDDDASSNEASTLTIPTLCVSVDGLKRLNEAKNQNGSLKIQNLVVHGKQRGIDLQVYRQLFQETYGTLSLTSEDLAE